MKYVKTESLIIAIGLICWIILLTPRTEKNKPVDKNSIEYITGYEDALMYIVRVRDSIRAAEDTLTLPRMVSVRHMPLRDIGDTTNHAEMKSLEYYYDVDVNGDISALKDVTHSQK